MRRLTLLILALTALPCWADVVVIANRTRSEVTARIKPIDAPAYALRLASGQVTPLFSDAALNLTYATPEGVSGSRLDANCAYYFGESRGRLSLHKIGLHSGEKESYARPLPGGGRATPAGVVNVTVYVDEEEATPPAVWRRKLQTRVEHASAILLAHSGMTLRLTGFSRWDSDDATRVFDQSLREFEEEALAPPGGLAIGFSSQYHVTRGRTHLGGTRGPLSSHILLREWSSRASENDRLELLVHELGHYLGATHSPEPDSVMRPVLADHVSRLKEFGIRFDPVNTLVMSMVGEEVRRRGVRRFSELSPGTRTRINQVYRTLAQAMPQDASAANFAARTEQGKSIDEVDLVRRVIESVTRAATENHNQPEHSRLTGDELTEYLVRRAAADASPLRERAARPLLLGLAVAFDDTAVLRGLPATGELVRAADPPEAVAERSRVIGAPTMWGRNDLAKHFLVSAALTAALDAQQAEALGLGKELIDANRQSGFSFADLAADRAGVRFAQAVLSGKLTPVDIADSFAVVRFMPSLQRLPEGLSAQQFVEQFGSTSDARFTQQVAEIDGRIGALTGHTN